MLVLFSLVAVAKAQSKPQGGERSKETPLTSDARAVLGKVNYNRARELTLQLQNTLRLIKVHHREFVSTSNLDRQRELERILDDEIGKAVEQTAAILSFLQESGFEDVVYKHKEELTKGFTRESLPPYEKEIFVNAGFSEEDFNQFVSLFETKGYEILVALQKSGGVAGLKDQISTHAARDKGKRVSKLPAYLKIFAGALGVAGDCTIGIIVGTALPPAGAVGVVASSAAGISYAADGVKMLEEKPGK